MAFGMAGRPKRRARLMAEGKWPPARKPAKKAAKAGRGKIMSLTQWQDSGAWDLDPYSIYDKSGQADMDYGGYTLIISGDGERLHSEIGKLEPGTAIMGKVLHRGQSLPTGSHAIMDEFMRQQIDILAAYGSGRQIGSFLAGMF